MVETLAEEICWCVVLDVNETRDELELSTDVETPSGELDVISTVLPVPVGAMSDDDTSDDDEDDDTSDDVILVVVSLPPTVDDWVSVDETCGANTGILGDRIGACRVGG